MLDDLLEETGSQQLGFVIDIRHGYMDEVLIILHGDVKVGADTGHRRVGSVSCFKSIFDVDIYML